MDKEVMKGSIDILLLSVISKEDMYGYDIVKSLKKTSDDLYTMKEGTLYPALKRLETKGLLSSYWQENEDTHRRKYYQITDEGLKALEQKLKDWHQVNTMILKCSEGTI